MMDSGFRNSCHSGILCLEFSIVDSTSIKL